jgi:hypothetical protein
MSKEFEKRRVQFLDLCQEHNFEDSVFNWTLWKSMWIKYSKTNNVKEKFLQWKEKVGKRE